MSHPSHSAPGAQPTAAPGVIELWHAPVSVDQPGRVEQQCELWLDASERARAARFRQPTSRNQHVVGRGMARRLLARAASWPENQGRENQGRENQGRENQGAEIRPESIRFEQSPLGKPFVAAPPAAKRPFNIAHTARLAVCAIEPTHAIEPTRAVEPARAIEPTRAIEPSGRAGPNTGPHGLERLGVDVERSGRRTDPELARRFFSRPEYEFLTAHADPEVRRELFLRIWTLKESFIKAIGTGLQTPLADFAFADIRSSSPRIRMLNPKLRDPLTWSFFVLHPRPGFTAAVAVGSRSEGAHFHVTARRFEGLLEG